MNRCSLLSVSALLLTACSFGNQKTLGDLEYKPEQEKTIEFESMNYQEVREEYQELLSLFKDDELKEQIERRIADVFMLEGGEEQLESSKQNKSYYADAIKSYKDILVKYPNSPDNADVLYQLARAYDMDGHTEDALKMLNQLTTRHPNYKNRAEAHFRTGDIYFTKQQYKKAQSEYSIVTRMNNPKLAIYAHYMLGWAHYKQFNYRSAVNEYATVVSLLLVEGKNIDDLDSSQQPLVKDSIQSMSLALAKSGGAELIETIASLNGKPYLWLIYDSLGEYYLEKERFEDSANTFRQYVRRYNFSANAPTLHSKLIYSYIKGGFPLQALKEKEVFVDYYSMTSKYATANGGISGQIKSQLKVYFDELASHYHSKAQLVVKRQEKEGKKKKSAQRDDKIASYQQELVTTFERAAYFYSQYIATFPSDPRVPEMTFLKAEAHFSAAQYTNAVQDFENVAYELNNFIEKKYQAKAGYAAIISYQKHLEQLNVESPESKRWQAKSVESMLKFAQVFHQDKRSPSVLANAAESLFELQQYQRALEVAESLIGGNSKLDKELKKTALGIAAHSYFKLDKFESAEENYLNQRSLVNKEGKEYQQISERLATSLYMRSEELITAKDNQSAIAKLLRIKNLTPNSKLRVSAQYNAATLLLATQQWAGAILELKQMIEEFPKDKLAPEFSRKLAFAYEKQGAWKNAGDSYLKLSKHDKDEKVRQEALFIAAGLYEKNKNYTTAIDLFKRYARTYEKPFSVRMEARYRLAQLYQITKQPDKKLFWLRRIVAGDKEAKQLRNDRSRWLGAWANAEYGDYYAKEFRRLKLTSSLDKTLPKKNKMLQNATQRYEAAAEYNILEFVTMSSVKIADLYQQLAFDLRKVSPPRGLTSEEQTMYAEIIEEQAFPFEQLALELHFGNVERAWKGSFDRWINSSFEAMKRLSPSRFDKQEVIVSYGDEIR